MNKGLSDKLNSEFCWNVIPAERPTINFERIPDPNWLAGFVDGEGCFYINTKKTKGYITGYQVIMTFSISQHVRDESFIKESL